MQLLKVQIKNWQTFSNVSLECKDFLVFIGASSTGKSSFEKASSLMSVQRFLSMTDHFSAAKFLFFMSLLLQK